MTRRIGIVMGSESDLPVMRGAEEILETLNISFERTIVSAHRTPSRLFEYAARAAGRDLAVIIAGAGGAAHLPGMLASLTPLPVIGVPISSTVLNGQDALLSIVQMPRGVPVATVAIDNSTNAGLLAAQILGSSDPAIRDRVSSYRHAIEQEVLASAERATRSG